MEETKKLDEATKPEEVAERAPLTDEQLDQATSGMPGSKLVANGKTLSQKLTQQP